MKRFIALLTLGLMAACTVSPPDGPPQGAATTSARPVSAILYAQALNVIYDDGALCAADRPIAKPIWGASLSGCPHLHAFTVEENAPPKAVRLPLQLGAGGPDARVKLVVVIEDGSTVAFAAP